jgi:5-methylcytosine-specific restriction endonuclease McrA
MTRARRALERARKIADSIRGRTPKKDWTPLLRKRIVQFLQVAIKQRDYCEYCGTQPPPRLVTLDHGTPLSAGGSSDVTNLYYCCQPCNERKGILTRPEYLDLLARIKAYRQVAQEDLLGRLRAATRSRWRIWKARA